MTITNIDFSRRVSRKRLSADIESYYKLNTVLGYTPTRYEASPKSLKSAYEDMIEKQKQATELAAKMKAAANAARHAEVSFHDAVLMMKESVRGQFGSNSDEAQAIGYKKKSEYKKSRRRSVAPITERGDIASDRINVSSQA